MKGRFNVDRTVPRIFWVLALSAIAIWGLVPGYVVGWDLNVYKAAVVSLRAGHDPYTDGTTIQRTFHAQLEAEHRTLGPGISTPFTYVYSPITLPLLRAVGRLPFGVVGPIYWVIYALSTALALWVSLWALEGYERTIFAFVAPIAVFFPGLLQQDVLFSGNVAYILHGAILGAALIGWRKNNWTPFYVIVLLASCFKAPLLSMVAIPVLSARKQWLPAGVTAALGLGAFALQPRIWPDLFKHYLDAVELQFSFNHDFSSSPAGLLADALYDVVPYRITSGVFYLFCATLFGLVLLHLRRKFLAGAFSLKQWIPVMMVGVVLLNPRIMQYDVAPVTVFMMLVVWRVFAYSNTLGRTILEASMFAIGANAFGAISWRLTECMLLVILFAAGTVNLLLQPRDKGKEAEVLLTEGDIARDGVLVAAS